jgi:hypothetical protein
MKLCFVSVNGPREPYLLDEPRIKLPIPISDLYQYSQTTQDALKQETAHSFLTYYITFVHAMSIIGC